MNDWKRLVTRGAFNKVVVADAAAPRLTHSKPPLNSSNALRANVNQPLHYFRGIPYMKPFRTVKRHPTHRQARFMSHILALRTVDGTLVPPVGRRPKCSSICWVDPRLGSSQRGEKNVKITQSARFFSTGTGRVQYSISAARRRTVPSAQTCISIILATVAAHDPWRA